MEKLIYLARLREGTDADRFRDRQMSALADQLLANREVHSVTLQVADSAVAPAAARKLAGAGACITPELAISLWVNSANDHRDFEAVLGQHTASLEGYLVSESTVLEPPAGRGGRTEGSTQFCTFRALPALNRIEFIELWRGQHTAVALATQATFGYRQNLVVMPLVDGATPCDAIVEEHFPLEAMASDEIFFDAPGDAVKLQQHRQQMAESCARFIDFDSISVVHLSEYRFG